MKTNDYKEQNVIIGGKETSLLELKKMFGEYEDKGKKYIPLSSPVPVNKYEELEFGTMQSRGVAVDMGDNNSYWLFFKDGKLIKVKDTTDRN